MTDFWVQMEKHTPAVRQAVRDGLGMSVSQMMAWLSCSLAGKYKYIDRIPLVETVDMARGKAFDFVIEAMCVTGTTRAEIRQVFPLLSDEDADLVVNRAINYNRFVDYSTDKLQVPVSKPLHPMMFYGWADKVRYEDYKPVLMVDHKFSRVFKPMTKAAKEIEPGVWQGSLKSMPDAWKMQTRGYKWALFGMTGFWAPFQFHIVNAEDERIQIVKYDPNPKSIDAFPEDLHKAYRIKTSGVYVPTDNEYRCDWCNHRDICPKIKEQTETQSKLQAELERQSDFDPAFDM